MNPKKLQYLMGHSDIGVTMNTYTHLGLDDAQQEMERLWNEQESARKEIEKVARWHKGIIRQPASAGYFLCVFFVFMVIWFSALYLVN